MNDITESVPGAAAGSSAVTVASAAEELARLFDTEWEDRLQADPLLATYYGDHRWDDRLPDVSPAAQQSRLTQAQAFLDQLHAIDLAALSAADQLNYRLFEKELQERIAEAGFGIHYLALTQLSGPQVAFTDLLEYAPFKTRENYEAYLARLAAFPQYVAAFIELLRAGLAAGYRPAQAVVANLGEPLAALADPDPERSIFLGPLRRFPPTIAPAEQQRLLERAADVLHSALAPGFQELARFVSSEYLPAARPTIAAAELPDGEAYYAFCIRRHTTLDLTAADIHATGLAEVARISAEMEAAIRQAGFRGDRRAFAKFLRSDPRFYVNTPEALMKEVAWIMKRIDGELPRLFRTLPRTPYGLRQIPLAVAPRNTSAYYFPPAGAAGESAGFYYVNTYDLPSRPLYEYEALSLHEAVPGHHLQVALQQELAGVPNFRRYSPVTAFIEGWALYAERLGLEMGFFQDPYNNYGRLTYEMWRAARLVVDTGMHALGWGRQQAIDYLAEHTALSLLNIRNEIDRYIGWPGQALAYKIGELKIRALRQSAEQALGAAFDLRAFHDILLQHGAIPLDLLEANVRAWVAGQQPESS